MSHSPFRSITVRLSRENAWHEVALDCDERASTGGRRRLAVTLRCAPNAGLVSSGRIHPIPPDEITRHGNGAEFTASGRGLPEAIRRVLAEACPLSATGLA